MLTDLEQEMRVYTRDLHREETLLRTCPCGRECRTGETFVRHRQRCKVPFPPEKPGEAERWDDWSTGLDRTLRRVIVERPQGNAAIRAQMLERAIDRYFGTVAEIGREAEVHEGLKGFDAALIRLQYEVPPPSGGR